MPQPVPTVEELSKAVAIQRSIHHFGMRAPTPIWFKSVHLDEKSGEIVFRMLWLNDAYERLFLLPVGLFRHDYLYRTDFDVHPKEAARQYYENDLAVWKNREAGPIRCEEPSPDGRSLYVVKSVDEIDGRPVIRGEAHFADDIRAAFDRGRGTVVLPSRFQRPTKEPDVSGLRLAA